MKRHLTTSLCVSVLAVGLNAQAQTKPHAAWLIQPTELASPAVEVWRSETTNRLVWRLVSSDGKVLAEMPQPTVPRGFTVNFGQCKLEGMLRDDVLVIVRHKSGQEWSSAVKGVWLAEPRTKAFVALGSQNVECRNESYGV
jgi:hypothetical protein